MPPKAKLSIFEIQQLLQQRIRACGLCGGDNWELEPDISVLRLGNLYMPREGRKIRCVLLSCHDCGNTHLINVDRLIYSFSPGAGLKNDPDADRSTVLRDPDEETDTAAFLMADKD